MELTEKVVSIQATKQYRGDATFEIPAGKTLKIELSPAGSELLTFERPAQAVDCWVHLYIAINEVD